MAALGVNRLALDRFLERANADFPLRLAILFGSRARGDELVESDYDLILVSPAFAGLPFARRAAELLRWWELPEGADLLCYAHEEFERKARELGTVAEALAQGVVLWCPPTAPVPTQVATAEE